MSSFANAIWEMMLNRTAVQRVFDPDLYRV
jgi:hypothetical protein